MKKNLIVMSHTPGDTQVGLSGIEPEDKPIVNMTTPKAEAMEKAERIAREIVIEKKDCGERCRICTSFVTGWHTKECQIEEIVKAIASTIEPLLSAEKERDELKAALMFVAESHGWKLHSDGPPDHQILGLHPSHHQPDDDPITLTEISRAFLAKQGERI
jgi:hypothetical protein